MKKNLKKFLANQWTIAIIAPLLLAVVTPIWVSIWKKINIWESIKLIGIFLKNVAINTLSYKVPVWIIIISIIAILLILIIIFKILYFKNSKPNWYYEFREMTREDWHFKWDYFFDSDKKAYSSRNIRPICSCKCSLIPKSNIGGDYYSEKRLLCPNCGKVYNIPNIETLNEVRALIDYTINYEFNRKETNKKETVDI